MDWLFIQVIREILCSAVNYFSIVRHLRANRKVMVHLLASRFANNGFDEEGNLWNGWDSELEGYGGRGRCTRGLMSLMVLRIRGQFWVHRRRPRSRRERWNRTFGESAKDKLILIDVENSLICQ